MDFDWTAVGTELGLTEEQVKFAQGKHAGRTNAEAAREAGLGGEDGKRARQEGYRLSTNPGVVELLQRAARALGEDFDAVLAAAQLRAPELGRAAALEEAWVKTGRLPDMDAAVAREIAVEMPGTWWGWREFGDDPDAFDAVVPPAELRTMLNERIKFYRELIAEIDGGRMNGAAQ